jgi:hypothetical protein
MQDVSIAALSIVFVLLQPAYDLSDSLHLGRLGVLLLGTTGCLGGLMLVLPRLLRAEAYEPEQVRRINEREGGRTG